MLGFCLFFLFEIFSVNRYYPLLWHLKIGFFFFPNMAASANPYCRCLYCRQTRTHIHDCGHNTSVHIDIHSVADNARSLRYNVHWADVDQTRRPSCLALVENIQLISFFGNGFPQLYQKFIMAVPFKLWENLNHTQLHVPPFFLEIYHSTHR